MPRLGSLSPAGPSGGRSPSSLASPNSGPVSCILLCTSARACCHLLAVVPAVPFNLESALPTVLAPAPAGCAFVQYSKWAEAEQAIDAHNAKTVPPGGEVPLVVKFADARKKEPSQGRRGGQQDLWQDQRRQMGGAMPEQLLQVRSLKHGTVVGGGGLPLAGPVCLVGACWASRYKGRLLGQAAAGCGGACRGSGWGPGRVFGMGPVPQIQRQPGAPTARKGCCWFCRQLLPAGW